MSSGPGPFEVHLIARNFPQDITAQCRGLRYRDASPGGHQSASLTVPKSISDQINDDLFARIVIWDRTNGNMEFLGRIEDLGRTVDAEGQWREYTAVGSGGWGGSVEKPYVLLDKTLENWESNTNAPNYLKADRGQDPQTDKDAILTSVPQGVNTTVAEQAWMDYTALRESNHLFGGISYTHDSSNVTANRSNRFVYGGATIQTDAHDTTPVTRGLEVTTDFAVGAVADLASLRTRIDTAATPTSGASWASFYDVVVKSLRKNADGSNITTGSAYVSNTIRADDIVTDLLGRWFDGLWTGAIISTAGVHNIDQWAYLDGVKAPDMLSDLMALEPAMTWHAWGDTSGQNGLGPADYEWVPWPTAYAYEAEGLIIEAPSSGAELYTNVAVRYKSGRDFTRFYRASQAITNLSSGERTAVIDLSDEIGSGANATRVGDQFLLEHANPPNAGTLTLDRRIWAQNASVGRTRHQAGMIYPWQVQVGQLIKVAGVQPGLDTSNNTDRNPFTIFRIVGKDVDETGITTLELDAYPRTVTQALKRMARRARKR